MSGRPEGLSPAQLNWLLWGALASSLVRVAPGAMLPAGEG